jgi:hypothetical protein
VAARISPAVDRWNDLPQMEARHMNIIDTADIERLVHQVFPARHAFSGAADLGVRPSRPVVARVHGGPDPFLDDQFAAWLGGSPTFVSAYQLLNQLCRAGALPPGEYAVTRRR